MTTRYQNKSLPVLLIIVIILLSVGPRLSLINQTYETLLLARISHTYDTLSLHQRQPQATTAIAPGNIALRQYIQRQ